MIFYFNLNENIYLVVTKYILMLHLCFHPKLAGCVRLGPFLFDSFLCFMTMLFFRMKGWLHWVGSRYAWQILVWKWFSVETPIENTDQVWLQDYANHGLTYLIDFVHGKARKMPEFLQVGMHFLYLSVVIISSCLSPYNYLWLLNLQTIYGVGYHEFLVWALKWQREI